ncbi:ATP-binding cassette domain-containing protein, partial [Streptosporangium sp. NPDC002544]|uniref:ATP-binding cassette domain-containing protein n=1 Tax=Streptosporangium sp. NPDC002544 TaxID=3154538 RepID=UPI003319124A
MVGARGRSAGGATALLDLPGVAMQGMGRRFPAATGDVVALREVDLDIPDGQFCCLVGPSGCGKTTLPRILAGPAKPGPDWSCSAPSSMKDGA